MVPPQCWPRPHAARGSVEAGARRGVGGELERLPMGTAGAGGELRVGEREVSSGSGWLPRRSTVADKTVDRGGGGGGRGEGVGRRGSIVTKGRRGSRGSGEGSGGGWARQDVHLVATQD